MRWWNVPVVATAAAARPVAVTADANGDRKLH